MMQGMNSKTRNRQLVCPRRKCWYSFSCIAHLIIMALHWNRLLAANNVRARSFFPIEAVNQTDCISRG